MLILSTFNSDYLQNPALKFPQTSLLKYLFEKFTPEPIEIKYVNKNLIGELVGLNLEKLQSCAILFRLFDFIGTDLIIDIAKLEKHLILILNQIISIKQKNSLPFLVFLCPSPEKIYNKELKEIEKKYIKKFNENKIHVLTLSNVKESYKIEEIENPVEEETHIPYTPKFYVAMACLLARKLHAIKQKPFKVIVVDCDNTLWTGVAADDGTEGVVFSEHNILLQNYLVEQQAKGKIICLCSKNDEQTVLDVFNQRQAEMPLKLRHLSKYNKINWNSKSNNIKELVLELNLLPDSFRFIDDNPTEIFDVGQIPGVFCITMPQKFEEFKNHWAFDTDEHLIVTETDKNRTELYEQAEIKAALATKFNDPVEYLRSPELGQSITISKIDSKEDLQTIHRVSQLSGKTNQFNMFPKTTANEVSEIITIVESDERAVFIGKIKDNFSPEDITAVAIISLGRNDLTIDSFFVSCRVFRRGMEYEMLKHIAQFSQARGLENIKLKFKKSGKNNPVCSFLNILLEEINKDPIPRLLLNEETVLTLSVRELIDLHLDSLIRRSLNISQQTTKQHPNILATVTTEIGEKYLIELKQMTSSLKYLLNEFFLDKDIIDSITELEIRVNMLCNRLLGEEGQDKSLIARGLDSLKATELRLCLYESEKIIITIPRLLCEKTTNLTLIDYIKEQKRLQKNDYLQAQSKKTFFLDENSYNQIFPVSFQQKRIWLAEQQESANNSANYHMMACYKVSKNLDISRFKIACQKLIEIYDVFGASFFIQEGSLKQSILSPAHRKLNFQEIELSELSLEEAIELEMSKPWNMTSKAPLMHIKLFKGANYHIFFHVHHAIFDAISFKNCLDTLSKIYRNRLISDSAKLINFSPQYIEFIDDQLEKLKDDVYQAAAFSFWQSEFSQIETVTILPNDQALSTFKPATELAAKQYSFTLSFQDLSALKRLAKSTDTTCFSVVTAIFILLMSSYTYQKNITLVTATNGRGDPRFDKTIGFFVNLLILQFDLEKEEKFVDYLKNVNKKILVSQEFQNIPFNKIQEILNDQGIKDILLSPALIYQSYVIPELKLDNEIAELEIPKQPIIFDKRETCRFGHFSLFAQENKLGELIFILEYAEDLLSEFFIHSFANNLIHTIKQVCENPIQKLQEISVICDEEQNQLISLGQGPVCNFPEKINLVNQFQQNLRNNPENIALSCGQKRLNYKEVDRQATNLAHALIEEGVKQGNYVGIFLDANYLFFIAELAILKIGAIFIPLSKENPKERLQLIINDAKINFFIVDDNRKGLFDTNAQKYQLISIKMVNNSNNLDKDLPKLDKNSDEFCVLYTSGSTGTPKGVILQEKGIFRVVESPNFIEILPGDSMAQTANQAFDAAQLECWLAWSHGANLVLFSKETILDIGVFRNKLKSENITHMWLTAGLFDSHANNQPDLFKDLKYLMVGGDVVHKDTILKVLNFKEAPIIINGYGPTEASIFVLTHTFNKQTINDHNSTLIGLPVNETEVEIITALGSKTPLGGIGELFVKGYGVAKGYLNAPELLENRFTGDPGKRKYQTGDLVKYTTKDPQIMFMGRTDKKQIKINGNLVALEEIRHCLSLHPDIKQVEVLFVNIGGANQLVAFYTLKSLSKKFIKSANEEFHEYLINRLPAYMIPTFYIQLDVFIVNANGKLDKTQFQKFEVELNKKQLEEIPPQTPNGKTLLKIIKKRLPFFPNNIKANFMNFGCDSISAMEIINTINNEFTLDPEKHFHANDFYRNPSIEGLEDELNKIINNRDKKGSLRILKNGDSNSPAIIFIHPAGGGLSCFAKLIEQVEFDNICYGIEDPLLDSNQLKLLTMEQMAQNYLAIIINEIQGPFILVGYSFGGMLALEMAFQNESTSENPQNLKFCGLIDTWVVSCISELKQNDLKREVLIYCKEQREKANFSENSSGILDALEKLCEHHQEIGFKFKPRKLTFTPVCLLKATILNDKFIEMHNQDENNFLLNFLDIEKFESRKIHATHYDILEKVDENSLVELFSDKINEFSPKKCLNNFDNKLGPVAQSNFFPTPLIAITNDSNFISTFRNQN